MPDESVRVASNNYGSLYSVAFEKPGKKKVLIVLNVGTSPTSFNIKFKDKVDYNGVTGGGCRHLCLVKTATHPGPVPKGKTADTQPWLCEKFDSIQILRKC
jgi:hypothetical protein